MTSTSTDGRAVTTAIASFALWGMLPLLFFGMTQAGFSAVEIVGHRTLWSVLFAAVLVYVAKQVPELRAVITQPRTMAWLALSAMMICSNWSIYVFAATHGATLEVSLGYYLNPLLNMAAGALLFRERIDRISLIAIGLAAIGVVIQTVALGRIPYMGLAVALSFCTYAVIRKKIPVSAQTGLFVECLYLLPVGVIILSWLAAHGQAIGFSSPTDIAWSIINGPATVVPLALFAWSSRRLPLSTLGFIQFLAPTLQFGFGLWMGETMTPMRAASFAFIWCGALVFAFAAWHRSRAKAQPVQTTT